MYYILPEENTNAYENRKGELIMKVKSAAKINLMLDILKRLDNGYHSLFMIMQSVDLFDVVVQYGCEQHNSKNCSCCNSN